MDILVYTMPSARLLQAGLGPKVPPTRETCKLYVSLCFTLLHRAIQSKV